MEKIISLFKRDYEGTRLVFDEVVPGAEWVTLGEGVATRKFEGTCCMVRDGKLFKRYDAKKGKTPPDGFEPAQEPDEFTGHWPGWVPVGDRPDDRWHQDAFDEAVGLERIADGGKGMIPDGTYELCGPKIQGNHENYDRHILVPHGAEVIEDAPRTFDALRAYFETTPIEGVVWHHPDGRMVKLKGKDFGLKRGVACV